MIDFVRQAQDSGLGPQAEALREKALGMATDARARLRDGERQLRNFIQDKPTAALGIALGMGVFLGWLIKRR